MMGMGHAPVFAITIEKENINKLKLASYKEFKNIMHDNNLTFNNIAQIIDYTESNYGVHNLNNEYDINDIMLTFDIDKKPLLEIINKYNDFCKEFENKYNIAIYIEYHDQHDDGDRYDDINGGYFTIPFHDTFKLTDEALLLQKDTPFEISQFVIFG